MVDWRACFKGQSQKKPYYVINGKLKLVFTVCSEGGHGQNDSRWSFNTIKAYTNGSIPRQYFFDTNYFQLLMGLRSFQKSEFLKLIISFLHYFWCQNWDQWHKMSGKNTHIYFFYFRFKNKRVWAEKIRKKQKNPKT